MNHIFSFREVSKNFGKVKALNSVSFYATEGSAIALLGNNGSGKSTIINVLCNLVKYDEGEVMMYGEKITPNFVSFKSKIGIVLNHSFFVEEFTPEEYLRFVCKFQKVAPETIAERIKEVLRFLELEEYRKRKIGKLSKGNQMKISIAAAIIHNPEILILDEPFNGLDISTSEKILTMLKGLKEKKTIFITSHILDYVTELCDDFIIIDRGSVVDKLNRDGYPTQENLKSAIKERIMR